MWLETNPVTQLQMQGAHSKKGTTSKVKSHIMSIVSNVAQLCPTLCDPWTVAHQVPPSIGFSRQEYWSGLPFPSLGDLPDLGIRPGFPALQVDNLPSEPPGKPCMLT